MNHRSGKRIVQLINQIRSADDKQTQTPRTDRPDGIVRLFVVGRKPSDTRDTEQIVAKAMSLVADDVAWTDPQSVKSFILEHHMAAARLGFSEFFDPLYKVTGASFRTGLLNGSLPGAKFFCELVPDLIEAIRSEDEFAIARIVQDRSPLLTDQRLQSAGDRQVDLLTRASNGIACLRWYLEGNIDPKLESILQIVASRELLEVPRVLEPFVSALVEETLLDDIEEDADQKTEQAAWRSAINVPLSQVAAYFEYVSGDSPYDTHQRYLRDSMNDNSSHFYRELEANQNLDGPFGCFIDPKNALLTGFLSDAAIGAKYGIWKPIGDEAARLIRNDREYAELLNSPCPSNEDLWSDPVIHAIHFFDIMVTSDDIVVTSFNWGSQTASEAKPLDEIGIHLHGRGIADVLQAVIDVRVLDKVNNRSNIKLGQ
jgi:hypothetical protein